MPCLSEWNAAGSTLRNVFWFPFFFGSPMCCSGSVDRFDYVRHGVDVRWQNTRPAVRTSVSTASWREYVWMVRRVGETARCRGMKVPPKWPRRTGPEETKEKRSETRVVKILRGVASESGIWEKLSAVLHVLQVERPTFEFSIGTWTANNTTNRTRTLRHRCPRCRSIVGNSNPSYLAHVSMCIRSSAIAFYSVRKCFPGSELSSSIGASRHLIPTRQILVAGACCVTR